MRGRSPALLLECREDYVMLYFSCYSTGETRAFFMPASKYSAEEYFLKEDLTPSEILYFFRHTAGEYSEVPPEDLTYFFSGCKIIAVIP